MSYKIPISKIWLIVEAFLFSLYFLLGAFASITKGFEQFLVLVRIPLWSGATLYYGGYSGSLVLFGLYGFWLLYRFKLKAIPVFFFSYALWETFAIHTPIDFVNVIIIIIGLIGFAIARPKFNYKDPVVWALAAFTFLIILNFSNWITNPFPSNETAYEASFLITAMAMIRP